MQNRRESMRMSIAKAVDTSSDGRKRNQENMQNRRESMRMSIAKAVETKKANKKKVILSHHSMLVENMSNMNVVRVSRAMLLDGFTTEIANALELRRAMKVFEGKGDNRLEMTPKPIDQEPLAEKFRHLHQKLTQLEFLQRDGRMMSKIFSTARLGGFKLSMDDVIEGIGSWLGKEGSVSSVWWETEDGSSHSFDSLRKPKGPPAPTKGFVRVVLRKTDDILLFEQRSYTVQRESPEGIAVEEDNKAYDHLTVGKGRVRRRSEADAQTTDVLYKSREVNTTLLERAAIGSYVSNFEMYDTIEAVRRAQRKVVGAAPTEDEAAAGAGAATTGPAEAAASFATTPQFQLASMIVKRLLAGNCYETSQRIFRNMVRPDPLSMDITIRYNLRLLFRFNQQSPDNQRKAVTDLSWCAGNSDILAVSYGIYSFSAMHVPKVGYVCVWNIKNPDDPERCYYFPVPVVSVEFSPFVPTLLAVGLYDGSVEVLDITHANSPPIAVSQRSTSPTCEPVMAIRWISQSADEAASIEPFLALSQDGTITKYRIINSPYLLGFQQMVLERVEGSPEGLPVNYVSNVRLQANRHPQGLDLTMHPVMGDIYYVLTDDGCLHKCSTNYPHQHLDVSQAHEASVNCMDFSPWSPKLFLTCGNDWCVRVWMEGIFKPLLTLVHHRGPVHCAYWSRTHATVIVTVNRKSFDIWDIRRNILQPVSSVVLDTSYYTLAKFTRSGRSLALGNERGNVLMCALEDFPFPPHFQYEELEAAIFKAISEFPDLHNEVKAMGFFGYPDKGCHITS